MTGGVVGTETLLLGLLLLELLAGAGTAAGRGVSMGGCLGRCGYD